MVEKYLQSIIGAMVCFLIFGGALAVLVTFPKNIALAESFCSIFTKNTFPFSDPEFDIYGVPYGVVFPSHPITINVECLSDPEAYFITYGGRGSGYSKVFIYKTAYITKLTEEYKQYLRARQDYSGAEYDSGYYRYVDDRCVLPEETKRYIKTPFDDRYDLGSNYETRAPFINTPFGYRNQLGSRYYYGSDLRNYYLGSIGWKNNCE